MKIYVANSWKNEYYLGVVLALRKAGHEAYNFRNPPSGGNGLFDAVCTGMDELLAALGIG